MSTAKVQREDYIQFLIATPEQYSCTEAARVAPANHCPPAHDAFNRLLYRLEPEPEELWLEACPQIRPDDGILVLDDSTLDKPYAHQIALVGWHWSGKHHAVVKGINLLTLLWTDGDRHIPCDYSLYDKPNDGLSKNDLFRLMVRRAKQRGLQPRCVCFDTWYSSLDNLKEVRCCDWIWLTRFKGNRQVRVNFGTPQALSTIEIGHGGVVVHLPGYGSIRVFRVVARNGDTEHWATNDLAMDELTRLKNADYSWRIEEYHRGLKQHCGVENCQVRGAKGQRNHIGLSIRAFLRIEIHCFTLGISWFQATLDVIRPAVRAYLANPIIRLPKCA
jgi:putative transposase